MELKQKKKTQIKSDNGKDLLQIIEVVALAKEYRLGQLTLTCVFKFMLRNEHKSVDRYLQLIFVFKGNMTGEESNLKYSKRHLFTFTTSKFIVNSISIIYPNQ